jgi:hypothetical protein
MNGQNKEKFLPQEFQKESTRQVFQGDLLPLWKRADDGSLPPGGKISSLPGLLQQIASPTDSPGFSPPQECISILKGAQFPGQPVWLFFYPPGFEELEDFFSAFLFGFPIGGQPIFSS